MPSAALLFAVLALSAATSATAQPKPGDSFREFTFIPGKTLMADFDRGLHKNARPPSRLPPIAGANAKKNGT